MKNSSQTKHYRSDTRRKEEQKMEEKWSYKEIEALGNFLLPATIPPALFLPAARFFLLFPLCFFFPFYPCISLGFLVVFVIRG